MSDTPTVLSNFRLKPGHCVDVEFFIPVGCKVFSINLGKDENNYVLHFCPRFDYGDQRKLIFNWMENGGWKEEKKESFFPFQEGTDSTVCFKFEKDKITIQLLSGNPFTFPVHFPIEEISYLALKFVQLKSITVN